MQLAVMEVTRNGWRFIKQLFQTKVIKRFKIVLSKCIKALNNKTPFVASKIN